MSSMSIFGWCNSSIYICPVGAIVARWWWHCVIILHKLCFHYLNEDMSDQYINNFIHNLYTYGRHWRHNQSPSKQKQTFTTFWNYRNFPFFPSHFNSFVFILSWIHKWLCMAPSTGAVWVWSFGSTVAYLGCCLGGRWATLEDWTKQRRLEYSVDRSVKRLLYPCGN